MQYIYNQTVYFLFLFQHFLSSQTKLNENKTKIKTLEQENANLLFLEEPVGFPRPPWAIVFCFCLNGDLETQKLGDSTDSSGLELGCWSFEETRRVLIRFNPVGIPTSDEDSPSPPFRLVTSIYQKINFKKKKKKSFE